MSEHDVIQDALRLAYAPGGAVRPPSLLPPHLGQAFAMQGPGRFHSALASRGSRPHFADGGELPNDEFYQEAMAVQRHLKAHLDAEKAARSGVDHVGPAMAILRGLPLHGRLRFDDGGSAGGNGDGNGNGGDSNSGNGGDASGNNGNDASAGNNYGGGSNYGGYSGGFGGFGFGGIGSSGSQSSSNDSTQAGSNSSAAGSSTNGYGGLGGYSDASSVGGYGSADTSGSSNNGGFGGLGGASFGGSGGNSGSGASDTSGFGSFGGFGSGAGNGGANAAASSGSYGGASSASPAASDPSAAAAAVANGSEFGSLGGFGVSAAPTAGVNGFGEPTAGLVGGFGQSDSKSGLAGGYGSFSGPDAGLGVAGAGGDATTVGAAMSSLSGLNDYGAPAGLGFSVPGDSSTVANAMRAAAAINGQVGTIGGPMDSVGGSYSPDTPGFSNLNATSPTLSSALDTYGAGPLAQWSGNYFSNMTHDGLAGQSIGGFTGAGGSSANQDDPSALTGNQFGGVGNLAPGAYSAPAPASIASTALPGTVDPVAAALGTAAAVSPYGGFGPLAASGGYGPVANTPASSFAAGVNAGLAMKDGAAGAALANTGGVSTTLGAPSSLASGTMPSIAGDYASAVNAYESRAQTAATGQVAGDTSTPAGLGALARNTSTAGLGAVSAADPSFGSLGASQFGDGTGDPAFAGGLAALTVHSPYSAASPISGGIADSTNPGFAGPTVTGDAPPSNLSNDGDVRAYAMSDELAHLGQYYGAKLGLQSSSGFSDPSRAAAVIAGNMGQESSMNPAAVDGRIVGLSQMSPEGKVNANYYGNAIQDNDRQAAMLGFLARQNDIDPASIDPQVVGMPTAAQRIGDLPGTFNDQVAQTAAQLALNPTYAKAYAAVSDPSKTLHDAVGTYEDKFEGPQDNSFANRYADARMVAGVLSRTGDPTSAATVSTPTGFNYTGASTPTEQPSLAASDWNAGIAPGMQMATDGLTQGMDVPNYTAAPFARSVNDTKAAYTPGISTFANADYGQSTVDNAMRIASQVTGQPPSSSGFSPTSDTDRSELANAATVGGLGALGSASLTGLGAGLGAAGFDTPSGPFGYNGASDTTATATADQLGFKNLTVAVGVAKALGDTLGTADTNSMLSKIATDPNYAGVREAIADPKAYAAKLAADDANPHNQAGWVNEGIDTAGIADNPIVGQPYHATGWQNVGDSLSAGFSSVPSWASSVLGTYADGTPITIASAKSDLTQHFLNNSKFSTGYAARQANPSPETAVASALGQAIGNDPSAVNAMIASGVGFDVKSVAASLAKASQAPSQPTGLVGGLLSSYGGDTASFGAAPVGTAMPSFSVNGQPLGGAPATSAPASSAGSPDDSSTVDTSISPNSLYNGYDPSLLGTARPYSSDGLSTKIGAGVVNGVLAGVPVVGTVNGIMAALGLPNAGSFLAHNSTPADPTSAAMARAAGNGNSQGRDNPAPLVSSSQPAAGLGAVAAAAPAPVSPDLNPFHLADDAYAAALAGNGGQYGGAYGVANPVPLTVTPPSRPQVYDAWNDPVVIAAMAAARRYS